MADRIDLEPIFESHPAGKDSSVRVGAAVSAAVELPGLRLEADHALAVLSIAISEGGQPGFPLTLRPVFEGPSGVSAVVTLPGVSGGGALRRAGDQWRGVLQASLGLVDVSGFGILGEDKPVNLLLVLAAEFTPPIQLSFGFTLAGVGGVVGINRRPDRDRIAAAVSSGDLSRLLFPRDPVAEAEQLLPVLDGCFAKQEGSFVVGPMLKVGWGPGNMVAATVAVLISDDAVTVLGRIALTLPTEAAALIHLEALVVGRVDADGLAIDATLANSRIVAIPIEGDLRLRVRAGADGYFALSAGGFHPALPPPPGMAGMRRLSTHVSAGPLLDLRLEAYLALTTTAAQFGARVDLTAGFDGFGVRGSGAFDALFVFSPSLRFDVRFSASVSVVCADFDVASVTLDAQLSGPAPWRARGHATISVLFYDVDVDLPEITWGDRAEELPEVAQDPVEALRRELARPSAWTAAGGDLPHLVQLAPGLEAGHAGTHPLADLAFHQTALPLATELRRMDGVPLPSAQSLTVRDLTTGALLTDYRPEQFVPRQFFDVDDATQRTFAGYETRPGGFVLRSGGAREPEETLEVTEEYETLVIRNEAGTFAGQRLDVSELAADAVRFTPPVVFSRPPPLVQLEDPADLRVSLRSQLADITPELVPAAAVGFGPMTAMALVGPAAADLQVVAAWELASP